MSTSPVLAVAGSVLVPEDAGPGGVVTVKLHMPASERSRSADATIGRAKPDTDITVTRIDA